MAAADLQLSICPYCHRRQKSTITSQRIKDENTLTQVGKGKERGNVGREIDKNKIGKKNGTDGDDPRVSDLGRAIEDDFRLIKEKYGLLSILLPHCTVLCSGVIVLTSHSNSQKPHRPRPRPHGL